MNPTTMIQDPDKLRWSENMIIIDGDYAERVAFHLTVNFERMLGRRIPPADLPRWIDCLALDGGLRPGEHQTQVVLIHDRAKERLDYFVPGNYCEELNGRAFSDALGEFVLNAYPAEDVVGKHEYLLDVLKLVCARGQVKRVMVVADTDELFDDLRQALRTVDDAASRVTLFAMQPLPPGPFRQEILGYSLMNAMGISGDELK